jgi:hypothetical protein
LPFSLMQKDDYHNILTFTLFTCVSICAWFLAYSVRDLKVALLAAQCLAQCNEFLEWLLRLQLSFELLLPPSLIIAQTNKNVLEVKHTAVKSYVIDNLNSRTAS